MICGGQSSLPVLGVHSPSLDLAVAIEKFCVVHFRGLEETL